MEPEEQVKEFSYRKRDHENWTFVNVKFSARKKFLYYICARLGCNKMFATMSHLCKHTVWDHNFVIPETDHMPVGRPNPQQWVDLPLHYFPIAKLQVAARNYFKFEALMGLEPSPPVRGDMEMGELHGPAALRQGEPEGEGGEAEPIEHEPERARPHGEAREGQQQQQPKEDDDRVECGVCCRKIVFDDVVQVTSKCVFCISFHVRKIWLLIFDSLISVQRGTSFARHA